ncbi:MAG: NAD(P)H-dependent oxidoreductase [Bacteroidota bacterium]
MITIIIGTNRANSNSRKVALHYEEILKSHDVETTLIDLATLPADFMTSALYENLGTNPEFNPIMDHMKQAQKFVFIVPEYNGSFSGALKVFLDALEFPGTLKGKKCALLGVSGGIQGGVMAMSHLTDIFNYLGMHVLANKPKLMSINSKLEDDKITDETSLRRMNEQAEALISF